MQELITANYPFPLHLDAAHKHIRASQRWGAQGSGTLLILGMRSLEEPLVVLRTRSSSLCHSHAGQEDAAAAAARIWLCWRGAGLDEGSI